MKPKTIKAVQPVTVIGKFATLTEQPHGYTSKHYHVKVGKKYKIIGIDGSAYRVKTAEGIATIYIGSFQLTVKQKLREQSVK